jgi:hypothetical protein
MTICFLTTPNYFPPMFHDGGQGQTPPLMVDDCPIIFDHHLVYLFFIFCYSIFHQYFSIFVQITLRNLSHFSNLLIFHFDAFQRNLSLVCQKVNMGFLNVLLNLSFLPFFSESMKSNEGICA